jgi:hypothetical protein
MIVPSQSWSFGSASLEEKTTVVAGVVLVILSLAAILFFVFASVASILTRNASHYWTSTFVLSSIALGGWIVFYGAKVLVGGGVMIYRSNLVLFWFLTLGVLISASLAFQGPRRYIALSIWIASLVAANALVPIFIAPLIIWLKKP